jgi:hypothetical protein
MVALQDERARLDETIADLGRLRDEVAASLGQG